MRTALVREPANFGIQLVLLLCASEAHQLRPRRHVAACAPVTAHNGRQPRTMRRCSLLPLAAREHAWELGWRRSGEGGDAGVKNLMWDSQRWLHKRRVALA